MSHTFTIPYKKIHIPSRGDFPAQVKYSPIVATVLESKINRLDFSFDSIIDSGADYCVFPSQLGELIGLNVELGKRLPTYGGGCIDYRKRGMGVPVFCRFFKKNES